jgi:serine/threonine-protein kinase RsbW
MVRLELESSPETLTLVRGMLGGLGEQLALDPELLDDLKTAVSEAANNVVMHAYGGASGPLSVALYADPEAIEVVVLDQGQGIPLVAASDDRLQGVGIPIMRALADKTAFQALPDGGTEVWLRFAGMREGRALYRQPPESAPEDAWAARLSGDAVVSLSPVDLVGGVLGRLARALAARARFSLDRFSDVYLVTDALAAYTARAASQSRIYFGIATDNRRLELTIGPFRSDGATPESGQAPDAAAELELLSDEFEVRSEDGTAAMRLVLRDQRPRAAPAQV